MAWQDAIAEGAGGGLGVLAILQALGQPGGLQKYMEGRALAQTDPNMRAGIEHSPLQSSFYFLGGNRVPEQGPANEGQAPPSHWQTNLPPPVPVMGKPQFIRGPNGEVLQGRAGSPEPLNQLTGPKAVPPRIFGSGPVGWYERTPGSDQSQHQILAGEGPVKPPKPFSTEYFNMLAIQSRDPTLPPSVREDAKNQLSWFEAEQEKAKAGVATATGEAKFDIGNLPPATQKTLGQIDTTRGIMDRLMALVEKDPDVAAGRGLVEGRLENYIYQAGVSQTPNENAFQSLQAQIGVIGLQPFMGGVRRYEYLQDVRQHLPKPGDQLGLIKTKIREWRLLGNDMQRGALKWAKTQRKDIDSLLEGLDKEREGLDGTGAKGTVDPAEVEAAKKRLGIP